MCTTPQEVKFDQAATVDHMAAGGGHILLKTSDNNLFSCGWNSKGQLGNGTMTDTTLLQPIHSKYFENKAIKSMHCGWHESAIVCEDGSLYVWGANLYGQLGQPLDRKVVTTPVQLHLPKDEKAVSIGFTFRCSVIVTANRRAYLLGELRHFDSIKDSSKYEVITHNGRQFIQIGDDVEKLSCGQNHLIFVHPDNSVSGFGANQFGQTDHVKFGHQIEKMDCGWKHNGVLLRTGDVLLWGRNTYGQLGRNTGLYIDTVRTPIRLVLFEKFKDFHLGAEHGLAVTDEGQIFTFGWNEHGNCGNGDVENV